MSSASSCAQHFLLCDWSGRHPPFSLLLAAQTPGDMPVLLGAAVHRFAEEWVRNRAAELLEAGGMYDRHGIEQLRDLAKFHGVCAQLAEEGDHNWSHDFVAECFLEDESQEHGAAEMLFTRLVREYPGDYRWRLLADFHGLAGCIVEGLSISLDEALRMTGRGGKGAKGGGKGADNGGGEGAGKGDRKGKTAENPGAADTDPVAAVPDAAVFDHAFAKGWQKGYREGEGGGYERGHRDGFLYKGNKGREEAYRQGQAKGEDTGYRKGEADGVLTRRCRWTERSALPRSAAPRMRDEKRPHTELTRVNLSLISGTVTPMNRRGSGFAKFEFSSALTFDVVEVRVSELACGSLDNRFLSVSKSSLCSLPQNFPLEFRFCR